VSRRVRLGRLVREALLGTSDADGDPLQAGAVHSRYDQLQPLPEIPDGWQTGPPDFVIIGAQKSGTTWWQGLIEEHPQVVRPPGQRRELHYFDHFWDRWPSDEQFERYERYFPRPAGSLVGEKTPGYLYQPWVAPMLAHVAPDAKLIVAGEIGMREHRITEAIERGRYAAQLEWWLEHFAREDILLLQYERCVADTQAQLTRTFEFLGLPDHHASAEEMARTRKKSADRPTVPPAMRRLLAAHYASDLSRLRELEPGLDLSLWPNLDRATD